MMTPNSRSCHSTCWGEGLTSLKFSARENTVDARQRERATTKTELFLDTEEAKDMGYHGPFFGIPEASISWLQMRQLPDAGQVSTFSKGRGQGSAASHSRDR